MKVAILGTDTPALVAAYAVSQFDSDAEIVLYGPRVTPVAYGAKWFEREIPGLDIENHIVTVESAGDPETYVDKVGGPVSHYFRARNNFLAFNYHVLHDLLWKKFYTNILTLEADYQMIDESNWEDCNYIFNAAPRPIFYQRSEHHMFGATRHWRADEQFGEGFQYKAKEPNASKNLMIFDGTEDSSWFRITQLFGLMSVEWGFHQKPPIAGAYTEILPLGVPKDAGLAHIFPRWRGTDALAHVGALGRWEPSTDVGEVYAQVIDVLEGNYVINKAVRNDDDSRGYL